MAALPLVTVQALLPVVWEPATGGGPRAGLAGLAPSLFAVASVALAWSFVRTVRLPRAGAPAGILLVALLLRLLALPLAPTLSNDVHRYVWDGRVLLAGENPYRLAPDAPELAPLRTGIGDDLHQRLDHRSVPTVYPPVALGLFAAAAALPAPVVAWKALLSIADLLGCAALLALARRLALPAERTVWYAWNPLVVIETAGMGHVDALAVAAAVAAVLWIVRGRTTGGPIGAPWASVRSGAWAAAGTLAKLAPLLALPMWARQSRRPWLVLASAGALLAVALLPVLLATGGVPPGLVTYGVSWEFDGPLYEPLHRLLAAADAGGVAKAGLDRLKGWTGAHGFWNRFYPYAYPQLFAKLALALLLAAAVARSVFDRRPVAGPGALFGTALLASATVYPWYLLWVLPWAALALQPAWLLASVTAPLAYLATGAAAQGPVQGAAQGLVQAPVEVFPWVWLAVWGPPAALALLHRPARRWASIGEDPG